MDYLVCNCCFKNIGNVGNALFHFAQCGHLFCNDCVAKVQAQCPRCGSTDIVCIASNDRDNFHKVSHYFDCVPDLQDKLSAIHAFQETQKQMVMQKLKNLDSKYQTMKDAFWKNVANLKQLQIKYNKLKMAFVAERNKIEQMKASIKSNQQRSMMGNSQNMVNNNLSREIVNREHSSFTSRLPNSYSQFTPPTSDKKVVFKVPNINKAPKSASRYSSGTSRSSNTTINTPDFHHGHFSDSDDSDETMIPFSPKLY